MTPTFDRRAPAKRNAVVLSAALAINGAAAPIVISLGGLAGAGMLGTDKSLATLPISGYGIGLALGAMPAALLMRRVGRRVGFIGGACIGIAAMLAASFALTLGNFWFFCLALLVGGSASAFVQQYRFAAADQGDEAFRAKAISWVMFGGIGAAIIGPQTALFTRDMLAPTPFAGAFLAAAGLMVIGIVVLSRLRFSRPLSRHRANQVGCRPIGVIVRQPRFIVAVICAISSYALMSFVMTGAPLAMVHHGHSTDQAMLGIQWHVLSMYTPSFFTGHLIVRFGKERIVAIGLSLLGLCAVTNIAGIELWNFWTSLILLGIGWNFGFIGATAMLTETYSDAERSHVQGLNDLLVFGSAATASLLSGQALSAFGWSAVNWLMFPVITLCLASLLGLYWLERRKLRRGGSEQ
ncbi:MAG: MFS transporter [Lysobacteraceae bacterium]|nr:MAG: MFS transporter [Xanthomonadaceae bacterium]